MPSPLVDPQAISADLVARLADGPRLGMATTRHLLEEVATRMEITQNSTKGRELGSLCREALRNLDRGVLDYRTVD